MKTTVTKREPRYIQKSRTASPDRDPDADERVPQLYLLASRDFAIGRQDADPVARISIRERRAPIGRVRRNARRVGLFRCCGPGARTDVGADSGLLRALLRVSAVLVQEEITNEGWKKRMVSSRRSCIDACGIASGKPARRVAGRQEALAGAATRARGAGQVPRSGGGRARWVLHVWLWKENPSGMFAPTNPNVKCPKGPYTFEEAVPRIVPHK